EVLMVGVFVNAGLKEIEDTISAAGLNLAQLHGDEAPELLEKLGSRAFKALRPKGSQDLQLLLNRYPPANTAPAFLIEDDKYVANRNGLNMIEARFLQHGYHDRARQNLVHVFEYMIGNTEYSLVNPEPGEDCCHNADILSATESPPYIALPFDFDFSGLVNAPYAEPNPKYPINSVRRRFYKGLCSNNDILPETLEVFRHRRADMYRAIDSISDYGVHAARAASSTARYLDGFFDTINDPERVRERLIERCLDPETTVDEAE
ncbi:MAG: hypothetical protein JJ992_15160, partial [Planctomycetes bacterium]|nr:hypothetical protein [Planctomycetota bacterium]